MGETSIFIAIIRLMGLLKNYKIYFKRTKRNISCKCIIPEEEYLMLKKSYLLKLTYIKHNKDLIAKYEENYQELSLDGIVTIIPL